MKQHIVYVPGLGDRYDFIRKLGLRRWRRPGVRVTHVPMRWRDPVETFDEKLARIQTVVEHYPDEVVVLVGESAGGAVVLAAMREFHDSVDRVVTICGMNHGVHNVNPRLYEQNPAFQSAMQGADTVYGSLTEAEKDKLLTIYSSRDFTVRPDNSLITGVASYDLRTLGHMSAILDVLYRKFALIVV